MMCWGYSTKIQIQRKTILYNERTGFESWKPRWLFDGDRIKENDTPDSLYFEEDDVIEIMFELDGGGNGKGQERNLT